MKKNELKKILSKFSIKEILFQLFLALLILLFVSFNNNSPHFQSIDFWYSLHFIIGGLIINYYLLPCFFYKKKYTKFIIGLIILLSILIFDEENILEVIFFPHTKAKNFPGVLFTLIEILPPLVIIVGLKAIWDAQISQNKIQVLSKNQIENELNFLKTQINPHFLFNNLNNIYAYALEKSDKTPSLILKLSSLLRYMLYECKDQFVFLYADLENLKNFIELQEVQIEDRGQINFKIKGSSSNKKIAPLLLLVFIENAFKHSSQSLSNNIKIDIIIKITEKEIKLICKNNYSDIRSKEKKSFGIGLNNVKARLKLQYPNNHKLSISKEKNTFEVNLTLPLIEEKNEIRLHNH
ncbi:MAG: sensor histidine kinase [Bacteroidales bacterium]